MSTLDHQAVLEAFPQVTWDEEAGALIVSPEDAFALMTWLKEDDFYALDYLSNVTGVDYLPHDNMKKEKNEEGKWVQVLVSTDPGYMDVVYHLYSMRKRHGPLVVKQRIMDREQPVAKSVMPLYRSAEFQEREIFDLYGIQFDGHSDLRRIFMWDAFEDFPMRKDYLPPNDFEYEPTPHDGVLEKAKEYQEEKAKN